MTETIGWVTFNPLTHTYDTPDGTCIAAELVDGVSCLADVLYIASLREQQRNPPATPPGKGD